MKRARDYVIKKGGIEHGQTMLKFKLALFGLFPWEDLFYIPLFIFKNYWPFTMTYIKDYVGQWVYPHLTALAYLRHQRKVFKIHDSSNFLNELWLNPLKEILISEREKSHEPDPDIVIVVQEMLKLIRPLGSFGCYTVSTVLSMISLRDFHEKWP